MEITAAVLRSGSAPFSLETLELSDPRPDEVLVQMVAVGMCHTDLLAREIPPEMFAGPCVQGHEGAGIVQAVGEAVEGVGVGDHVVLSYASCGRCRACRRGRPFHCFEFTARNTAGTRPDGSTSLTDAQGATVRSHFFGQSSFASHAVVDASSVVVVDPDLDLTRLGPLGCGIQTGAGTIMNTLDVGEGESVVVAGAGALGLSAVMAARLVGAETIIALDRHPHRLELARRFGATETLSVAPGELAGALGDLTGGGADHAFDTTGNAAIVRACFEGLNNIGQLALAGVGFGELTFDFLSFIGGRKLIGVIEGDAVPQDFIPRLARLNAEGSFPFDELIGTFPFDEINRAEAASASGEVVKPVLVF